MPNKKDDESTATDSIVQRFTDAVLADQQATEDIFAFLKEVMVAVTVLISEVRKQDAAEKMAAVLAEIKDAMDEMLELLRRNGD